MLVRLLRTKPWLRRALSGLSVVLLLGGLGLVGYPFATNMWTDQIQSRLENQLEDQIASPELQQAYRERKIETGDSLTRIKIPALGLDTVVVEGITPSALRAGAGHYPQTPLPCEGGNVSIAGHRTTYGRPFNEIDLLEIGDTVRLETPLATHTYRVVAHPEHLRTGCPNGACWITTPTDWSVVQPTDRPMLTLTTCHPKGSAAQRLIVRAELVSSGPPARQAG